MTYTLDSNKNRQVRGSALKLYKPEPVTSCGLVKSPMGKAPRKDLSNTALKDSL